MGTVKADSWSIQDENGVIHSGAEDEMDIAWDYMTMSLEELYAFHGGEIPKEDLQEGIDKYKRQWSGELRLVHVIKVIASK